MSAKIIPIRGSELVPIIEEWLEQAKRGEIEAMAFVALVRDGPTCEGWIGEVEDCAVTLYGAINILRDGFFHANIDH